MGRLSISVLIVALVLATPLHTTARQLSEIRTDNSVDADFKNVYAKGKGDTVDQQVAVHVPDPSVDAVPSAVEALAPRDFKPLMLDPNNPTCTLGDKETYQTFSITDNSTISEADTGRRGRTYQTFSITDNSTISEADTGRKGRTYQFYVQPGLEIRPIVILQLTPKDRSGELTIKGDGFVDEEAEVDRDVRIRTLCGNWVWTADGKYEAFVKVDNANVILRYFARRRGQKLGAYNENSALNIGFNAETTVAGSNKSLNTQTDAKAETQPGKLVVRLKNNVEEEEAEDPFASGGFDWGALGL